ncbi:MAG: response regulator [Clostridia bacterium]
MKKNLTHTNGKYFYFFVAILLLMFFCFSAPLALAEGQFDVKAVKVGYYKLDNYQMIDKNGKRCGYGYEYLQYMASQNNFSYSYVGYDKPWSEQLEMLEKGEIDVLTYAHDNPQRRSRFDFVEKPIGTSNIIITVKSENEINYEARFNNFKGKQFGIIKQYMLNKEFAKFAKENNFFEQQTDEKVIEGLINSGCIVDTPDERANLHKNIKYYDGVEEMVNALQTGEIDATISLNTRNLVNETIVAELSEGIPFYIIVQKGDPKKLIGEMQRAIDKLSTEHPSLQSELKKKYFTKLDDAKNILFTHEELDFIASMKDRKLMAIVKPEREPLSYFSGGIARGIIPEIINEISKRSGINFDFVELNSATDHENFRINNDITCKLDATLDFNKAEDQGYKCTNEYMKLGICEITRKDIISNKKVAAQHFSRVTENYVNTKFSPSSITYFNTIDECVKAVKRSKVDSLYVDMFTAKNIIKNDVTNMLTYSTVIDATIPLCIAVSNGQNPLLLSVLNKAVDSIDDSFINSVINTNTNYGAEDFSLLALLYSNPTLSVALLSIVFFIVLLFTIHLANLKKTKIEVQKNNEFEKFITYVCNANDEVSEIDLTTKEVKIYSIDDEGKVNQQKSVLEVNLADIIHPDDLENFRKAINTEKIKNMIDTKGELYFETRVKEGEGYVWYSLLLQGMSKDKTHSSSFMAFKRNINDAKVEEIEMQQKLCDALENAQNASTAKGQFMSKMSHEIRTPLNAVIGFMTLASDCNSIDELKTYINKSQYSAKHLLNIINDILDISSIESGKLKIGHFAFDIKNVIASISTMFTSQANNKEINFDVKVTNLSQEFLLGDELRLSQVLINLLSNALKFTNTGGNVVLEIAQGTIKNNLIYYTFTVSDTGIGIDKEFLKTIFTPFEQESAKTAHTFGGTGLGLAISKNLVEMMNGAISVSSEKGVGTTFTVNIPFEIDSTTHEQTQQEVVDFSNVRALVVDDDNETCEYIKSLLKRCGVNTILANGGKDAIQILEENIAENTPLDLCLVDWKMPNMSGLTTIKQIRKIDKKIKIFVVTACDQSEVQDKIDKFNVERIITKPVFQSVMFDMLTNSFGMRKTVMVNKIKAYDFAGKRVLVAEDNMINMEIAKSFLTKVNFEVIPAKDGEEVVEIFENSKENEFDLILMDIQMPRLNGYEATKRIRESSHSQAKTIPIIAMTADAFAEDVANALSSGMNDHIAKPIDIKVMYETINKQIEGKQQ